MPEKQEQPIIAFINGRFVHKGDVYKETAGEEVVSVHVFEGPVAKVVRGYGLTLNLKNYESARLDVRVEVPCHVEDIDKADEWARAWVEERVKTEVAGVRNGGDKPEKKSPGF
jgi:hypothetical protein